VTLTFYLWTTKPEIQDAELTKVGENKPKHTKNIAETTPRMVAGIHGYTDARMDRRTDRRTDGQRKKT